MKPIAVLPGAQVIPAVPMRLLFPALVLLLVYDLRSRFGGFRSLESWASPPISAEPSATAVTAMVDAVDLACTWYPKTAPCLQRSAVLCRQLRQAGVGAVLVIGVQRFPFRSHAWVEVEGIPVNERARVREVYGVLDIWGKTA